MAIQAEATTATREPMSRDRVLRAAIELADGSGIDALSMRKLAKSLGVEAMTLYYYVANKEEILDGIVDIVLAEIELPPDDADWKQGLRSMALSAYDVLRRHPWAANLQLSRGPHASRLRYMEAILGTLRRGGFSAEMTHHAYHALEGHITGFTLWLVGMNLPTDDLATFAGQFLEQLPREDFPYLAEHVETHMRPMSEYTGSEFEFGLDQLLDGLERIREASEVRS